MWVAGAVGVVRPAYIGAYMARVGGETHIAWRTSRGQVDLAPPPLLLQSHRTRGAPVACSASVAAPQAGMPVMPRLLVHLWWHVTCGHRQVQC